MLANKTEYWLKAYGFKVHNISLRKIKPTKKVCIAKTAQVIHLTTCKTKFLSAMLRQPRERCHLWNSVGCETMWVSSQHGLAFLPSSSPKKALHSNSKLYWKQNAAMNSRSTVVSFYPEIQHTVKRCVLSSAETNEQHWTLMNMNSSRVPCPAQPHSISRDVLHPWGLKAQSHTML